MTTDRVVFFVRKRKTAEAKGEHMEQEAITKPNTKINQCEGGQIGRGMQDVNYFAAQQGDSLALAAETAQLRDQIALEVLKTLLQSGGDNAEYCYQVADAMLKARKPK